jgi:hypothetical protein
MSRDENAIGLDPDGRSRAVDSTRMNITVDEVLLWEAT